MKNNFVLDVQFEDPVGSGEGIEPITLDEAKVYLRVSPEETFDDTLISELITTARQQCEDYLNISLVERTVTATLKNELGGIWLPYGPIGNIVSVYKMNDGEAFETDEENLLVVNNDYYTQGNGFKQFYSPETCKVQVKYDAGYATLPHKFKTAIFQQLAWLYEHRGDEAKDEISPLAKLSMKPYRRAINV